MRQEIKYCIDDFHLYLNEKLGNLNSGWKNKKNQWATRKEKNTEKKKVFRETVCVILHGNYDSKYGFTPTCEISCDCSYKVKIEKNNKATVYLYNGSINNATGYEFGGMRAMYLRVLLNNVNNNKR